MAAVVVSIVISLLAWRYVWPEVPGYLALGALGVFVIGTVLWWKGRADQGSMSNLGAALLSGTVVAFAVLAFQSSAQKVSDRQALQVTVGMRSDLSGIDLRTRDLTGFFLRSKIFDGGNLSEATLTAANLRQASLRDVTLDRADLRGADLRDADLSSRIRDPGSGQDQTSLDRADLRSAILSSANLRDVSLDGANLSQALLDNADLSRASLSDANLREADLSGSNLRRVSLPGADLRGSNLRGANLSDTLRLADVRVGSAIADRTTSWPTDFDPREAGVVMVQAGADLAGIRLNDRSLEGVDLRRANLGGAELRNAILSDVDLTGADLRGADLTGARLVGVNLRGARLDRADLRDVAFVDVLADLTTDWPGGFKPSDQKDEDLKILEPEAQLASGYINEPWSLSYANLRHADLSDTLLEGVNLRGTDLSHANLVRTRLENCVADSATRWPKPYVVPRYKPLPPRTVRPDEGVIKVAPEANLRGRSLKAMDLTGADLRRADLRGADLRWADLRGAKLEGAKFEAANLRGADLTGASLAGADLDGAIVDSRTTWPGGRPPIASEVVSLEPYVYLIGAHLRGDLSMAELHHAFLRDLDLQGVDLTNADLSNAALTGANLRKARFAGADLTDAELARADLRGATANSRTLWPEGFNARAAGVQIQD